MDKNNGQKFPKLIKPLPRKDGNGNVYKILPVGTEMNVTKDYEVQLINEGYLADPEKKKVKNKEPKKKIEPETESNDLGELQTDKNED